MWNKVSLFAGILFTGTLYIVARDLWEHSTKATDEQEQQNEDMSEQHKSTQTQQETPSRTGGTVADEVELKDMSNFTLNLCTRLRGRQNRLPIIMETSDYDSEGQADTEESPERSPQSPSDGETSAFSD